MSTVTATPQRFIVYAPDKTEEGTFQHRLSVRPDHVKTFKQHVENGVIRVGGILLSPDAEKKMIGSMLIVEAESIDEVRKIVEADIYYTAGVWDREKMVILPFQAATPIP
ncbi:hypothetical protein BD779DRAFT_1669454 [Infundibulicybe gibba]|nr:hypothetical protein BD779DRAFT_1669454 [Infundibulicybe gibba]